MSTFSSTLITGFSGKDCSLPRMAGLGVLVRGSAGERPPTVNLEGGSVLGFRSGEFWDWSLVDNIDGTWGKGPRGAGLGGGISNCRDLIEPPGLGIGMIKSLNEGAGSIGEGPRLACAGSNAAGVVLAATSNLFLTVPVDGIDDVGSGETITISLGTGECSEACLYSEDRGDRERGDGLVFNGRICGGAEVGEGEGCGLD